MVDHVKTLGLYVKVAWLGDALRNVTQALLRKYGAQDGHRRSLVVLARSPGDATLVDGDAFVSVSFPPCDFFAHGAGVGCSYARRRLAKLAWTHLDVVGRQAYEVSHDVGGGRRPCLLSSSVHAWAVAGAAETVLLRGGLPVAADAVPRLAASA